VGRRIAVASGIGALLGLAWFGLFELIAAGVVCTKDDFGCLGMAVVSIPVFALVAWALGWFALRSLDLRWPWLTALFGTVVAVLALLLVLELPVLAPLVFAITYALAALFG
jgi:hypothetical protein